MRYRADYESLQQHAVPEWFHNAKLGIFVHWGLFSVPGWAPTTGDLGDVIAREGWEAWFAKNPYAEWYLNSIKIPGSPSHQYHVQTYGEHFDYDDFAPLFNQAVAQWDPVAWAALFRDVGARYVVLVTKHHDGFLLWPSAQPTLYRPGYQTQRDLVGELTAAVREQGMEMGLYYSGGLDWTFRGDTIRNLQDIVAAVPQEPAYVEYADAHWRELIDRYAPKVLWNDIGYPTAADLPQLFAHYYNNVPDGVINDRFVQRAPEGEPFGEEPHALSVARHFDFRTPEYTSYDRTTDFKWEATRGIGHSFGYNRNEGPAHYLPVDRLVQMFVDIVSKNGNLLLNIGPMADGTIPEIQRERLEGLGAWLKTNGEAIFDTRPWVLAEGSTTEGLPLRYTQKGDSVYVILLETPRSNRITLEGLQAQPGTTVSLLGQPGELSWQPVDGNLQVALPAPLAEAPAHAFKITPAPTPLGDR